MANRIYTNYNGAGVYAIIDIKNFCAYVGSSSNIKTRLKNHLCLLRLGKHQNKQLQQDFNSGAKFDFVVLEKNNANKRLLLAKEYLYMLDMIENGFILYNIYGGNKKELKNIICHNAMIILKDKSVYNDLLVKKYKIYKVRKK